MINRTIYTSEEAWLAKLATNYKNKTPTRLIDDAGYGVDPMVETLFNMARKAHLSACEIAGVCVALGMSAIGVGLVVLAFVDPEPTSKLGLLVAGGLFCILGGGYAAIQILTNQVPPNVKFGKDGFEIKFT